MVAPPGDVFTAVAAEVAGLFGVPHVALFRYEREGLGTMIAGAGEVLSYLGRPWPCPAGDPGIVDGGLERPAASVPAGHTLAVPSFGAGRTSAADRCAGRVVDYSRRRGAFAVKARELGLHSVAGAPIIVDGDVWGLVTVASTDGPLPDRTEDRLAEFTELLGTAIANTQSRTELSASRARIVAAADETRRRLERDLHDGIQQRLVSLALKARTIETMAPQPAGEIAGELSLLADGLGTAMDELREISHGIHPAVLSEAGLGPALEALARRSAVPVDLDLTLGQRLGEHVEAAGYYIASEAITNVTKHARASVITMRVDGCDGALILSISDDGVGGADPGRGSGIIGLKDRVEALGGTISMLSPPGHGTALHVQLPANPMVVPALPGRTP